MTGKQPRLKKKKQILLSISFENAKCSKICYSILKGKFCIDVAINEILIFKLNFLHIYL